MILYAPYKTPDETNKIIPLSIGNPGGGGGPGTGGLPLENAIVDMHKKIATSNIRLIEGLFMSVQIWGLKG